MLHIILKPSKKLKNQIEKLTLTPNTHDQNANRLHKQDHHINLSLHPSEGRR